MTNSPSAAPLSLWSSSGKVSTCWNSFRDQKPLPAYSQLGSSYAVPVLRPSVPGLGHLRALTCAGEGFSLFALLLILLSCLDLCQAQGLKRKGKKKRVSA